MTGTLTASRLDDMKLDHPSLWWFETGVREIYKEEIYKRAPRRVEIEEALFKAGIDPQYNGWVSALSQGETDRWVLEQLYKPKEGVTLVMDMIEIILPNRWSLHLVVSVKLGGDEYHSLVVPLKRESALVNLLNVVDVVWALLVLNGDT